MAHVKVTRGRAKPLEVKLDYSVEGDVLTSQIRETRDPESALIADWSVAFVTDGSDGHLLLTLTSETTAAITQSTGFMDIKRVSNGVPLDVFDSPLKVIFTEMPTA